jgi:hypothetical protein
VHDNDVMAVLHSDALIISVQTLSSLAVVMGTFQSILMQSLSIFSLFAMAFSDDDCSFLQRARQLQAPIPTSTLYGETEGSDFWFNHSSLLLHAWREWEVQQNLTALDDAILIYKPLRDAVQSAWKNPQNENQVRQQWELLAPGVYKYQLLNPRSIHLIREHVDAASFDSGIPTRRPNGMNRYGLILYPNDTDGSVSLATFDAFLESLLDTYIRPMARTLFSEYISQNNKDDMNAYAFTIRYQQGEDVSLEEHSDASLYTLNVNLNLPQEDYQGSSLYFVDQHGEKTNVTLKPGEALLHLGMTRHASLPIQGGSRINMVVWLYGQDGTVRIAPYEPHERLTSKQRWSVLNDKNEKQDMFDFEL